MRAVLIETQGEPARLTDVDASLLEGPVELEVLASSYNYKDGLAVSGTGRIARTLPLIAGIDVVGRVVSSEDRGWSVGETVVLTGDGLGETRHGGFATTARVRPDALVRLPAAIGPERAAAIGTAGFTAMLAVLALEDAGVAPDAGDILVTGSAGGVGSLAIALLARRGYRVVASTGRADTEGDYLRGLGAAELLDRRELSDAAGKPLQSQRWAGAVDSVGSTTLANILAQTSYGGTVVACGLAQGADLPTTVMPFILRAVTLTGANSVEAPIELRQRAWYALAEELDLDLLDGMTTTITLDDTLAYADEILGGRVRGRTVVLPG